jgi:hypothetical protein
MLKNPQVDPSAVGSDPRCSLLSHDALRDQRRRALSSPLYTLWVSLRRQDGALDMESSGPTVDTHQVADLLFSKPFQGIDILVC